MRILRLVALAVQGPWVRWKIGRKISVKFGGRVFLWRNIGMEAGYMDYVELARCFLIDGSDVFIINLNVPINKLLKQRTEVLVDSGAAWQVTDEFERRATLVEGAKLEPELMLIA